MPPVHTITFPRPSVPYRLEIGQYDAVAGENLIFILPDGRYTPTIEVSE